MCVWPEGTSSALWRKPASLIPCCLGFLSVSLVVQASRLPKTLGGKSAACLSASAVLHGKAFLMLFPARARRRHTCKPCCASFQAAKNPWGENRRRVCRLRNQNRRAAALLCLPGVFRQAETAAFPFPETRRSFFHFTIRLHNRPGTKMSFTIVLSPTRRCTSGCWGS